MELTLNILVILVTVALTALGSLSMFAPKRMLANFAIAPEGVHGLSTVRAVIGGLFLASVGFLLFSLITGQTLGYLAVALVMAVVAFGRIVSILADGFNSSVVPPLIVELVIVAILVASHQITAT